MNDSRAHRGTARWPQVMPCGGTGGPVHPVGSSAGLLGEPVQPLSLSAREAPDSILLTVKNLKWFIKNV